jgi:hypothetical protein
MLASLTKLGLAGAMLTFVVIPPRNLAAQPPPSDQPDLTVDAQTREEVVRQIARHLTEAYVFPDVASRMGNDLCKRLDDRQYDEITSAKALARTLTEHLRAVSHDKHIRVV